MSVHEQYPSVNDYSESLLVHFRRIESLREEALSYPGLDLNSRQLCDLELLLNRAYFPLVGYNNRKDYESIRDNMKLANGMIWPMPICLDIKSDFAKLVKPGESVAINDPEGFMLAVLKIEDVWQPDKKKEAKAVFGTNNGKEHPGVQKFYDLTDDWYIGGRLEGLHLPIQYDFNELRLTPPETHRRFYQNGWRRVIAFHADDFLHCQQREMIMNAAREANANIFLQPVVKPSSQENLDHYTHVRCFEKIAKRFPKNMTMLGLMPFETRMAGPREALWQAMVRKNYGCSHFMVAEDHADPFGGNGDDHRFYAKKAAQDLVKIFESKSGIKMVPLRQLAYVEEKAQYLPLTEISGDMRVKNIDTKELKRRLENNLEVPEWFTYPEIVEELQFVFPPKNKQGFTLFFTGLSGSGKSTLAKVLYVKFMEMKDRPVTLLDGDIVRKNLSSELNFSKEHRNLNITRIGFVASEITKNGGIAICAPIAPYEESRRHNRALIGNCGGFIEVHVSTPLETCEMRDRKGLYAKARAGKVKGVTGVSDPYEVPENPELVIDTTDISPTEAAQEVLLYLEEQGYIE